MASQISKREVIYYDVSPFAALSAVGSADNIMGFSDIPVLFLEKRVFRSIQTCERNYTVLDGTHSAFADNDGDEQIAMWSAAQSRFPSRDLPAAVTLDVRFGGLQSSPGISFYFDRANNGYCDRLRVRWFRGNILLDDKEFNPDDTIYSCVNQVDFYDRITVTFIRLNMPYRFLRVEAVIFGVIHFFRDNTLESLIINEGADPTGRSIYINSTEFAINTGNTGATLSYMFLKRQPIFVRYNNEDVGVYYIDRSRKYADRRYSIQAIDKIGVLDNTDEYLGGIYANAPAQEIIRDIIGGLFVPDDIDIDANLRNILVSGWIPICRKREALAQVALAINAVIDTSRDGKIKVRGMPSQISSVIGRDRVYTTSNVDIAFPYTGIELISHNYAIGSADDTRDLFKDTFEGEKIIKFAAPHSNYAITNGTILEIGANYARITSTGIDECVLRGRPFIDNQNSVVIKTEHLIEGTQEKIEKIDDGYLVNNSNAQEIAERLYQYYSRQEVFNGDILLDNSLDNTTAAGRMAMERICDVVTVATAFTDSIGDSGKITGQIEKLTLNLGYKNIKARGVIRGNQHFSDA